MADYIEIEDVRVILRANRLMAKRLQAAMRCREIRRIGHPAGSFERKIFFQSARGNNVFWWAGGISDDGELWENFFGRGQPRKKALLNIDLQINFPIRIFDRRKGGLLLKHKESGATILAHRGIVTIGHARVRKSDLFDEMMSTIGEAEAGNNFENFLLICPIDSPTIQNDISEFAGELRRTVQLLRDRARGLVPPRTYERPRVSGPPTKSYDLKGYFDEFSGKVNVESRKSTVADCYHGAIVRAVRDFYSNQKAYKTVEIDLVVDTDRNILLFEIKPRLNTQSLYTATGQLAVHGIGIAALNLGKPISKVLVVPFIPKSPLHEALRDSLGIKLVTFERLTSGRVKLDGLSALV